MNCRFGVRLRGDDLPDVANTPYDHSHYYAYDETDRNNFWPTTDVDGQGNRLTSQKPGDKIQLDPLFANYNVNTAKLTLIPNDAWDFHLTNDSPGLNAGKTDFTPVLASVSAGGVTINVPAPSNFIGAYGVKGTTSSAPSIEAGNLQNALQIYPNPVRNQLNLLIKNDQNEVLTLQIVSFDGKVVLSQTLTSTITHSIDVSDLPQGIYLCRVQGDNTLSVSRFVKK